ncbi:MAG: phage holin family protein [Patescibacteria group bacterium]|jgi:putative membrane protein|nr:phage holin family protein [Patescibacteria group bacterium]
MNIKKQAFTLFARWLVNTFSLWLAVSLSLLEMQGDWPQFIVGGLLLALLNAIIKPLLVVFSLPIVALSLGLFMVVINATILYFLSWIYDPLQITSFFDALLAGIVISLINYIVTILFERLFKNNE